MHRHKVLKTSAALRGGIPQKNKEELYMNENTTMTSAAEEL
jgi:hypothetical protein